MILDYDKSNGFAIFKDAIEVESEDVKLFIAAEKNRSNNPVKNYLWKFFNKLGKDDILNKYQKVMLNALATYCDLFPESVYSLQWQEDIEVVVDYPGSDSRVINPVRTKLNKDGYINSVPSNRQVVIELVLDSNYEGGSISWEYLECTYDKITQGSILVYPASFFWTKTEKGIISGRRVYLRSYFNGGKDFFVEDEGFYKPGTELLFSYMR